MPTIIENGKIKKVSIEEYNNNLKKQREEMGIGADGKLKHSSVDNLGKIWINGQEFTGMAYQGILTVNTKTYVEEPTRANDGSMPNINDHDTFVVPRCKVNFKYFNIEDYRRLCKATQSNEFYVEYYDKDFDCFVKHKMYCEPQEMVKLYNVGMDVFGVLDYEVSFIGTLNSLETFSVVYVPAYWDGDSLVNLSSKSMAYNSSSIYYKGQVVEWQGFYYQAIYYENSFTGISPTTTSHWEKKQPSLWNDATTYNVGDFVYRDVISGDSVVRKYYEAKKENFYGFSTTNKEFWTEVSVAEYSSDKTYTKGQYAYVTSGSTMTFYQAIYYKETFTGQNPDNTRYWTKVTPQINVEKEVEWGRSVHILTATDLSNFYQIPIGKVFKGWNTRANGQGLNLFQNSNFSVFEDITIYPILGDVE